MTSFLLLYICFKKLIFHILEYRINGGARRGSIDNFTNNFTDNFTDSSSYIVSVQGHWEYGIEECSGSTCTCSLINLRLTNSTFGIPTRTLFSCVRKYTVRFWSLILLLRLVHLTSFVWYSGHWKVSLVVRVVVILSTSAILFMAILRLGCIEV